jgi:hypothetical protein
MLANLSQMTARTVTSFGQLQLFVSSGSSASITYSATQNISDGVVTTQLSQSGSMLMSLNSVVLPTSNVLITTLTSSASVSLTLSTTNPPSLAAPYNFPTAAGCSADGATTTESCSASTAGIGDWMFKCAYNVTYGPFPICASMVTSVVSSGCTTMTGSATDGVYTTNSSFTLSPNCPTYLVTVVSTNMDATGFNPVALQITTTPAVVNPTSYALQLLGAYNSVSAIAASSSAQQTWWNAYWLQHGSSIVFQNSSLSLLHRYWWGANYLAACIVQPGKVAPGLWGPFATVPQPNWQGDIHMDYNYQSTFWGLPSGNRLAMSNAQHVPVLQYQAQAFANGQYYGCTSPNCPKMPISLSPYGLNGCDGSTSSLAYDEQSYLWAFAALNMIDEYEHSLNDTFLEQSLYPYLVYGAQWWQYYLVVQWTNASAYRYVNPNDCTVEGCYFAEESSFNAMSAISMIRRTMSALVSLSQYLQSNLSALPMWADMTQRLSVLPVGVATVNGVQATVLLDAEDPTGNSVAHSYTQNIWGIFPAQCVGMHSHPFLVMAALNSITKAGWGQGNEFGWIFSAAVRVGYPTSLLLSGWLGLLGYSNNNYWYTQYGGGVETLGAAEAVQSMLLQSNEYAISLLPVWPAFTPVSFRNVRAKGAFLIGADFDGSRLWNITIVSEKGRTLAMFDPFAITQAVRQQILSNRYQAAQGFIVTQAVMNQIPFPVGNTNVFPPPCSASSPAPAASSGSSVVYQLFPAAPPVQVSLSWYNTPPTGSNYYPINATIAEPWFQFATQANGTYIVLSSSDAVPMWNASLMPSSVSPPCSTISYTLEASSPFIVPPNPYLGLVNWFPLVSNFSDALVPAVQVVVQGPPSCSAFDGISGTIANASYLVQPVSSMAWTQLCNTTSGNTSSLLLPNPTPSGNSSVCVWFNTFQPFNSNFYLFGCNNWTTSSNPSCPTLWMSSNSNQYRFKMVNPGTGQFGNVGVTIALGRWTHVCLTYSQMAQQMSLFVNGAFVLAVGDVTNTTMFGNPVLASTSVSGSGAFFVAFLNWRLYSIALPGTTISYIYQQEQAGILGTAASTSLAQTYSSSSPPSSFSYLSSSSIATPGQISNVVGQQSSSSSFSLTWATDASSVLYTVQVTGMVPVNVSTASASLTSLPACSSLLASVTGINANNVPGPSSLPIALNTTCAPSTLSLTNQFVVNGTYSIVSWANTSLCWQIPPNGGSGMYTTTGAPVVTLGLCAINAANQQFVFDNLGRFIVTQIGLAGLPLLVNSGCTGFASFLVGSTGPGTAAGELFTYNSTAYTFLYCSGGYSVSAVSLGSSLLSVTSNSAKQWLFGGGTGAVYPPALVIGLSAVPTSYTSFSASWAITPNAVMYVVQVSNISIPFNTSSPSGNITGLALCSTYTFNVTAVGSTNLYGPTSAPYSIQTACPNPSLTLLTSTVQNQPYMLASAVNTSLCVQVPPNSTTGLFQTTGIIYVTFGVCIGNAANQQFFFNSQNQLVVSPFAGGLGVLAIQGGCTAFNTVAARPAAGTNTDAIFNYNPSTLWLVPCAGDSICVQAASTTLNSNLGMGTCTPGKPTQQFYFAVPSPPAPATYDSAVFDAYPHWYWRLNDTNSSSIAMDATGNDNGNYVVNGGLNFVYGVSSLLYGNSDTAIYFPGSSGYIQSTLMMTNPSVYSFECWFQTTSNTGGVISAFVYSAPSVNNTNATQFVYMSNGGSLHFYLSNSTTVSGFTGVGSHMSGTCLASYNDGSAHYLVTTLNSTGMWLYLDGSVCGNMTFTPAVLTNETGNWVVGGYTNVPMTLPALPNSSYFQGTMQQVATYIGLALSDARVALHYSLG